MCVPPSGLKNVRLPSPTLKDAYFCTYLSASKSKEVAITFREEKGVLFEISENIKSQLPPKLAMCLPQAKGICCDVSWISKFPDEQEVLFRRGQLRWDARVIEENENGQYVALFSSFLAYAAWGYEGDRFLIA